jgi:hypothetical protein
MAYAKGKAEEHRALLTTNQMVELAAEVDDVGKVKVDAGKAAAVTPAAKVKQGRKETQLGLQEAVGVVEVKEDEQGELAV